MAFWPRPFPAVVYWHSPFPALPRLGCPLRWGGLGRQRASVVTPCTRAPPLAAPRVLFPFLEPASLCCVHRCGCLVAPSSAPPSTPWLGGWLGSGLPPFRLWEGSFRVLFAGGPYRVAYWPRPFPAAVHWHPPFPAHPSVGLSPSLVGSWSAAGFGGDPLHSRTHFGGASRSFTLF